jgi:hypothetical protein
LWFRLNNRYAETE